MIEPSSLQFTRYVAPRGVEGAIVRRLFEKFLRDSGVLVGSSPTEIYSSEVVVALPRLFDVFRILLKPDLNLGELYVQEKWLVDPNKLFSFLYAISSNKQAALTWWFDFTNGFHPFRDWAKQRLIPIRSTRAVKEHYNTDPYFMRLILGDSMSYTCAFFADTNWTLEQAQEHKLELIGDRLGLSSSHSVLDIGCGWGANSVSLAKKYGCHVHGITISDAQKTYCDQRASRVGVSELCKHSVTDFALLESVTQYDRITSVGMLEHVGKFGYGDFFDTVFNLLKPGGKALIHCMVSEVERSPDAWIDRHIFPGGYIPCTSEVVSAIDASKCRLLAIHLHQKENYFRTLNEWKERLFSHRSEAENILKTK